MHQVPLAVLILSICVYVPAGAIDTPKKVSSDELIQIVTAAQGTPDAELAQKLSGMALTDRFVGHRLTELTGRLPGDKSRLALMLVADQSIFLPPSADEMLADAAPNAAAAQQMLLKVVKYVNATVRQLPNLMATRRNNGFEDQPREDTMGRTGVESTFYLPLHWVGSLRDEVTYRDRREAEDKSVKVEKKGNGVGGLITTGVFGPILSIVLADAAKSKIAWTRWEKGTDGTLAVFHYQVAEDKSNYHVKFCCILAGYELDGTPKTQIADERSAYHGDIVFSPADGSIRLLTMEADPPADGVVSGAGIAVEYSPTDIGGRSYICPVRSVSMLQAHTGQQGGAISSSKDKVPVKTFLNDVRFSNYRRFGTETKVLTNLPSD